MSFSMFSNWFIDSYRFIFRLHHSQPLSRCDLQDLRRMSARERAPAGFQTAIDSGLSRQSVQSWAMCWWNGHVKHVKPCTLHLIPFSAIFSLFKLLRLHLSHNSLDAKASAVIVAAAASATWIEEIAESSSISMVWSDHSIHGQMLFTSVCNVCNIYIYIHTWFGGSYSPENGGSADSVENDSHPC